MFTVIDCLGAKEYYSSLVLATAIGYQTALETRAYAHLYDKNGAHIAKFDYHFDSDNLQDYITTMFV